jgi:hypothetical protein
VSLLTQIPVTNNYLLARRFSVELDLIKGIHQTQNTHPSLLHFSVNKSATQYVKSIVNRCSAATGLVNVGIHDYAFKSDFPYLDKLSAEEMTAYQHIFKPAGYTYSVFGGMIDGIANLEKYLIVLMVRDPRDVLVSGYFSIAYSHVEPALGTAKYDDFLENRANAQAMSIDDYAIAQCDAVYETYNRYKQLLLDRHSDVYLTRYEDMIDDFEIWLQGLINYCQFQVEPSLLNSLIEENEQLRPSSENVNRHIRKGKAGDYKEKLKAETIDYIESKLAPVLPSFGYV